MDNWERKAMNMLNQYMPNHINRYKHVIQVYRNMCHILNSIHMKDYEKDMCKAAAILHDIGYVQVITGFHPVDGYLLIQNLFPTEISTAVLQHSFSIKECCEFRPDLHKYYQENKTSELGNMITTLVSFCDYHSDGYGNLVTVSERYQEISNRHGSDSDVYKYMLKIRPHVDNLVSLLHYELNTYLK